MHVSTDKLRAARMRGQPGAIRSVTNNNGNHSANGDFYASVTLPSLIVAPYDGGNGRATQRECLEIMDCYGSGEVRKLAEIVAATVLAGELSLGSVVVAEERVQAHDDLGRNRP